MSKPGWEGAEHYCDSNHSTDEPEAVVSGTCRCCEGQWTLSVPRAGFLTWKAGTLIQDALPGLPPADRELLISGTCGQCFSDMFDLGPELTRDAI